MLFSIRTVSFILTSIAVYSSRPFSDMDMAYFRRIASGSVKKECANMIIITSEWKRIIELLKYVKEKDLLGSLNIQAHCNHNSYLYKALMQKARGVSQCCDMELQGVEHAFSNYVGL